MSAATLTALDGNPITLDAPVNVKVKGEKTQRKNVVLVQRDDSSVFVKTGKRGRPAKLAVEVIQSTKAL